MNGGTTSQVLWDASSNSSFDNILKENEHELSGNRTASPVTPEPEYKSMYCEPIESVPLSIVSGIVATATIAGNLLVILAILRGSSRFHRPMYWLIIHLSCADLLVGLMLLWNYCLASLLDIHNTITSLTVVFCIWITSEAASTIGFVLLAVDRYVQIFHKSFHRTYATRVTVGLAIFLAWGISLGIFALPPLAFRWSCVDSCECRAEKYMQCLPRTECSQIIPPFKKNYTLAVAILLFACIPIPIVIYSMIFIKVRKKTQVVKHSHRRHDIRLIQTLSVILAVFIITLSPVAFLGVVDYYTTWENDSMIDIAFYIFVLAFLNSLANPLLYMWRMAAIRRSIRQRVFFCFRPKNGQTGRRDFTSFQSDQRSPTTNRQRNDENRDKAGSQKFISQNNNMPIAAVLCLRQMKRGRYTNSRTSTPLSERANHQEEEGVRLTENNVDSPHCDKIRVHSPIDKNPLSEDGEETVSLTNNIAGNEVAVDCDEVCNPNSVNNNFECRITEL